MSRVKEICDLNPQKTCRFVTKLVPKLEPVRECTVVPKETCRLETNIGNGNLCITPQDGL